MRRFEWAGVQYEMRGPRDVKILSRRAQVYAPLGRERLQRLRPELVENALPVGDAEDPFVEPPREALRRARCLVIAREELRMAAVTALQRRGQRPERLVDDGRHLVEIAQEARNQDGELSVVGGGVVELPEGR